MVDIFFPSHPSTVRGNIAFSRIYGTGATPVGPVCSPDRHRERSDKGSTV